MFLLILASFSASFLVIITNYLMVYFSAQFILQLKVSKVQFDR